METRTERTAWLLIIIVFVALIAGVAYNYDRLGAPMVSAHVFNADGTCSQITYREGYRESTYREHAVACNTVDPAGSANRERVLPLQD